MSFSKENSGSVYATKDRVEIDILPGEIFTVYFHELDLKIGSAGIADPATLGLLRSLENAEVYKVLE